MGIALKHLSESDRIRIARELFKITRQDEHKGELHGCCPVHGEKNASFSYNYRTDTYHCFACGAHGSAIDLVKQVEGLEFLPAVQWLARQFSIRPIGNQASRRVRRTAASETAQEFAKEVKARIIALLKP